MGDLDRTKRLTVVVTVVVLTVVVEEKGIVRHEQALEMRDGGTVDGMNVGVERLELLVVVALR